MCINSEYVHEKFLIYSRFTRNKKYSHRIVTLKKGKYKVPAHCCSAEGSCGISQISEPVLHSLSISYPISMLLKYLW